MNPLAKTGLIWFDFIAQQRSIYHLLIKSYVNHLVKSVTILSILILESNKNLCLLFKRTQQGKKINLFLIRIFN
jgi:hypothetical protein